VSVKSQETLLRGPRDSDLCDFTGRCAVGWVG